MLLRRRCHSLAVAAIEQGRYSPSLESALKIARIFGKPVEEIFRWEDG
ncbi:MAG: helix-turn-helix domain-containing protein [Sphingobium sp.]|nr:helix-turn-helix domain-containing protein [Sphingobium sp.]